VVNLSLLWHDAALDGHATTLVVTRSGLALEVDSYSATRESVYLTPLRPALGNHALRYASLLEGQPLPIVDTAQLITTAQWQSLAATA